MTLQEIRQSKKNILLPKDVAEVLDSDPHTIRIQARDDPTKLGFPVSVMGSSLKIPREGFLNWWDYRAE